MQVTKEEIATMIVKNEAEKIAQNYAIAEVRKMAALSIIRVTDDTEFKADELALTDEAPSDCWYIFCEDNITGLEPHALCGNLNSERLICILKTSGEVILDEIVYTD